MRNSNFPEPLPDLVDREGKYDELDCSEATDLLEAVQLLSSLDWKLS